MASQLSAETKIQRLWDIEEIKVLKYRYVKAMTFSDWNLLAETLTEDVQTSYSDGKYTFNSRREVLNLLESSHDESLHNIIAYWHVTMPIIEFSDNDHATGSWGMYHRYMDRGERNVQEEQFAFYDDAYVRTGDGWRICRTGYRRIMEQGFERGDIPTLKFLATRFD